MDMALPARSRNHRRAKSQSWDAAPVFPHLSPISIAH